MTTESPTTFDLAKRVHDMVRAYVFWRTEVKSGRTWESFKDSRITDPATGENHVDLQREYRQAREKVCEEAFLAIRSRRSREDFVSYFTSAICAAPQFLPVSEYQGLAGALLDEGGRWEDVKSLAMLTLSSLSRV